MRVKSIVKCVTAMEMPPDNITDFLVGLVEEGNYFPPEFLWKCETEKLEFNRCGKESLYFLFIIEYYNMH